MKNLFSILKKQKYLILLFFTGIAYLWLIYGHALKEPNNFLATIGGDGIKNYYAYITEVRHGDINQLSFNYPYGENYLFTDSHPFLSKTLHYANKIFPHIENHSIGILNVLMIFNILLTYLVLFLLLRRFIKQEWYALLWAFAILLIQPQIYGLAKGHFALSYSLAIPLCFYWLVLYYQTNHKILYGILLSVSNFIWLGTHAYLGVMTCGFAFLFDAYQYFSNKEYRNVKDVGLGILKSIIPLVIFFIYISIIDTHTGRSTNTGGFFYYCSNLCSVFMPYYGEIERFFEHLPAHTRTWEGRGYIGIVSTICFFTAVFFFIKYLLTRCRKTKNLQKTTFEMGLFAPAFFAAIIFLLFSMGYPFKLELEFLLDYMSFIKNFRTIGRFTWPFFFVATTFSAYAIYQYVQIKWKDKKKFFLYFILIAAPILTIIEGIPYQKRAYKNLFDIKNPFLLQNLDLEYQEVLRNIDPCEYQAIIPLPFYQGSENFNKLAPSLGGANGVYDIYDISNIFAFHFDLPLMASYLSRTSIWESKNLMQMFAPEYYEKLIKEDIPSNKKFLILYLTRNALTEYEQNLLQKASFLLKANEVEFWEITYENMTEVVTAPYISDFIQKKESLISYSDYFLSKPDSTLFLFSFDTNNSQYQFLGGGAYEQPKKEKQSIFAKIEPHNLEENRIYEASFWYYVGGKNHGQDKLSWKFYISQKDEQSGEVFLLHERWSMSTPVVLEDWAFATYRFTIPNKNFSTLFAISNTDCKGYQTTIDEFLVRPLDVDVYRIIEQDTSEILKLYKNGQIIDTKKSI